MEKLIYTEWPTFNQRNNESTSHKIKSGSTDFIWIFYVCSQSLFSNYKIIFNIHAKNSSEYESVFL